MPRSFYILCLIVCCSIAKVNAQTGFEYADTTILRNNTEAAASSDGQDDITDTILYQRLITIPKDSLDSWKNDKKFAYVKNMDTLLKLKDEETMAAYQPSSGNSSPSFLQRFLSSGFIQTLFWMIAIGIVIFILYKLVLSKGNFIFRKNSSSSSAAREIEEAHDIDNASDYDALIRQSYKLEDYRMAVRYLFLKTLRLLADKQLLQHSTDKTNFQYVQEMVPEKKNDFANLVLNYEYIWYGNLKIVPDQYTQVEKKFTSFNSKI